MLSHFLQAVVDDGEVGPEAATFADGLQAARIAAAIRRSAESGAWESVAQHAPRSVGRAA
jgi:predicted dehydrogenase